MKLILGLIILVSSVATFAEDSVSCGEGYGVNFVVTDKGTLRVSRPRGLWLLRTEVTYKNEPTFQTVTARTVLKEKPLRKVRATYDDGTSVRRVYEVDFKNFQDGAEIPVMIYDLFPAAPNGRLEFVESIECESAQS